MGKGVCPVRASAIGGASEYSLFALHIQRGFYSFMNQSMKFLTLTATTAVLAFSSLFADVANGGIFVDIKYKSRAPNQSVGNVGSVTLNGSTVNLNQGGGFYFQEAGAGTIAAAGLETTMDGLLLAFCIELTQTFNTSSTMTYEVIDLKNAPK